MDVALIGLGQMGSGIAANLVAAGHQVTVWNRDRTKAEPFAERGATVAAGADRQTHERDYRRWRWGARLVCGRPDRLDVEEPHLIPD